MQELETIAGLKRSRAGAVFGDAMSRRLRRLRLHCIKAEDALPGMSPQSALNLDWSFLTTLRDAGRAAAEAWLLTALSARLRSAVITREGGCTQYAPAHWCATKRARVYCGAPLSRGMTTANRGALKSTRRRRPCGPR